MPEFDLVEQLKGFRDFCREEGLYSVWTLILVEGILWLLSEKFGWDTQNMVVLLTMWPVFWVIAFCYVPKRKNGKLTILLAIETDKDVDQKKFKADCIDRCVSTLREAGLDDRCKFIIPKKHQCRWFRSESGWRTFLFKFVRPHFSITGTVKKRGGKMFIEPKGLVVHKKISNDVQRDLANDFSIVLPKEISIDVNEEAAFRGFQISADIFSHAALFIIGNAALLSNDYKFALEIHEKCKRAIVPALILPTAQHINKKIRSFLFVENYLIARMAFYANNIKEAVPYINVALELEPTFYEVLLLAGAIKFKQGEAERRQALEIIKRAKKQAGTRFEWMFSLAFLYLWFENYPEALKIFKKIERLDREKIQQTIQDVLNFNQGLKDSGAATPQVYLWTGFLEYKILENLPSAFADISKYKEDSNPENTATAELTNRWISELSSKMSII